LKGLFEGVDGGRVKSVLVGWFPIFLGNFGHQILFFEPVSTRKSFYPGIGRPVHWEWSPSWWVVVLREIFGH